MALARIKNWISEVLSATDLNAEFNNILTYLNNTGLTLTSPVLTTPSVTGLLDLSGASSGQIKFAATQNASADVNTLDDYEEGTWTPVVGGNATYTLQTGTYTKIGRLVYIRCDITINLIGTGSATLLSGLPFATTAGVKPLSVAFFSNIGTSVYSLSAYVQSSGSTVAFTCLTGAVASVTDVASVFQNAARVIFAGCYETT